MDKLDELAKKCKKTGCIGCAEKPWNDLDQDGKLERLADCLRLLAYKVGEHRDYLHCMLRRKE